MDIDISEFKAARVERSAPLVSESAVMLWFGDIPEHLASSKRVSEIVFTHRPEDMPMPHILKVVRKGYRVGSRPLGNPTSTTHVDLSVSSPIEKDTAPWHGYALLLFRDPVEATQAIETVQGSIADHIQLCCTSCPVTLTLVEAAQATATFDGLCTNNWVVRVQPGELRRGLVLTLPVSPPYTLS